ncbi:hypothetical protein GCM10011374_24020 [Kocuria dechangensis]|uniref:Uncharacterized protein n=1 Tax=Kocuria dechangensis TaxID=1176249 RepID=A0A917GXL5_9MICC|nr:hypothetical protein GCM10011374_24020 [Kocuria dechangensis]
MTAYLRRFGLRVAPCRVDRLMRVLELIGAIRGGRVPDSMLICWRVGWWSRTFHSQVLPKG